MAVANEGRTAEAVRRDIELERELLAGAVERLRVGFGQATDVSGRLRSHLPAAATAALGAGFAFAGGVGAAIRYFAGRRPSR